MGAKLWYPFHPAAVETDAAFMQQVDAVCRDLGERGKPKARSASSHVSEGVPPAPTAAATQSLEPSPALASVLAPRTPAPAPTATTAAVHGSFTPSIQLSSPPAEQRTMTDGDPSLVLMLLEQQKLMLRLLREVLVDGKASSWAPYLNTLPRIASCR